MALWRSVRWLAVGKFFRLVWGPCIVCLGHQPGQGRLSTPVCSHLWARQIRQRLARPPGDKPEKSLGFAALGAAGACGSFVSDAQP